MVLAAQAGSIEPGAESETVVLVRNTGAEADVFHVVVEGGASPWAVVDPPTLSLAPGEEAPAWIHFRPPRASETPPGRVPFAVAVASSGDPDFVAVETGELEIGTYSSVTAAVAGEPTVGPRWTELVVGVRNTGNRKVNVVVDAEAAAPGVVVDVEPPEVALAAGQPGEVVVRVRPPRRLLPRRKEDRRLTISVISDGGALATLRTEYPDDPSLVNELIRSARVLGVLLVLLFVGGIALLRSETTSGTVDVTEPGARAALPVVPDTSVPEAGPAGAEVGADPGAAEEPAPSLGATPAPARVPPPALPRIAFVRVYGAGVRDVIVRDPSGRELRLRSDNALEARPRLSPDGAHVAFIRERDAVWRVCVMPSAGGEANCFAETSADAAVDWSPDGATLYFSRSGSLVTVAYDVATASAGPELETGVAVAGGAFSLAPDGSRLVLGEGRRLVMRPLDGSPATVVEVASAAADPSFSPDGSRLVYTADYQVYTVAVGGGRVHQLTSPGTVNGDAAWTGDGDWVVFRTNRSGSGDLYVVHGGASGGSEEGLAQITSTSEREVTPSF